MRTTGMLATRSAFLLMKVTPGSDIMKKPHYAWAICFACLLLYICNLGLCSNIFTVYLPFIESTGISHGAGSAILSVRAIFSFVTTFFVDALYRKVSLRKGIFIVSFCGAFAPLIMSIGGRAWIYYLGSAAAGIAYGAGCVYPSAILINKWFGTSTGLALGICSAGSGICSMLFSPIVSSLALHFSLRSAFLFQAAVMALCAVIVFVIIRDTPEEIGISPYIGRFKAEKVRKESTKVELSAAMLGWLAFMMLLNGGTGVAFSGHLSVLTVTCGYTQNTAAACVSVFGLALIVGKLCAGYIADHIGACKCGALLICTFIVGCLFSLGMDGNTVFWCYALAAFLGFGAAVYNVCPALWAADLSSSNSYRKTLKWLQLFYNLGGIVFPTIPGMIADRTGEYRSSYITFAAMMCISLLILTRSYRRRRAL